MLIRHHATSRAALASRFLTDSTGHLTIYNEPPRAIVEPAIAAHENVNNVHKKRLSRGEENARRAFSALS